MNLSLSIHGFLRLFIFPFFGRSSIHFNNFRNKFPDDVHQFCLIVHHIRTKPIHYTQKVVEEKQGGIVFSINVIPNFELERELIGFGEGLKVLSPNSLVRRIKKKVQLMQDLYSNI